MWKKILVIVLSLSLVIEALLTVAGFVAPERMLELFGLSAGRETLFLAHVISWMLGFIAAICGLALWCVKRRNRGGRVLSLILGYWWIGIGLALFFGYGRVDNLFLDTLKGLALVIAAHKCDGWQLPA